MNFFEPSFTYPYFFGWLLLIGFLFIVKPIFIVGFEMFKERFLQ